MHLHSPLTPEQREETIRFMQPFATSTKIAVTFRCEDSQQQQQQNNALNVTPDPFEGIDLDLLDVTTRKRIEDAKALFATNAKAAAEGKTTAEQLAQTQKQLAEAQQAQIQNQNQQQQQQQQQQNQAPTMEDDLRAMYLANGVPPDQVDKVVKLNAGMLDIHSRHFGAQVQQSMQPLVGEVVDRRAATAFDNLRENDSVGYLTKPDVAQYVWDKTQEMAKGGKLVNDEVVRNFARIAWARDCEEHGMPDTSTQRIENQQQPQIRTVPVMQLQIQPPNQNTRFTYPGAGNVVRNTNVSRGNIINMDPDTQAAVDATTGSWDPKLQQKLKANGGGR